MKHDVDLQQQFRDQHGAATDRQIRGAGISLRRQQRLIADGMWQRAAPGVIVAAGAPDTWHRRASVVVLGSNPSAALSHGSAARLYGLDGYSTYEPLHVTVAHGGHRNTTVATQHTLLGFGRADTFRVDGITAVRMPLALIGAVAVDGRDRAGQALDSALRAGRSPLWFSQGAQRWLQRGRPGPRDLLDLIAERTDKRLPRSWFQRLAHHELAVSGITLVHEHPVFGPRRRLLAELDLADVEHRIGVECQSWEWHATPAAQRADATRKRALRRLGWEIVEVWWSDLRRMDDVIATIRAIRAERATFRPQAG